MINVEDIGEGFVGTVMRWFEWFFNLTIYGQVGIVILIGIGLIALSAIGKLIGFTVRWVMLKDVFGTRQVITKRKRDRTREDYIYDEHEEHDE